MYPVLSQYPNQLTIAKVPTSLEAPLLRSSAKSCVAAELYHISTTEELDHPYLSTYFGCVPGFASTIEQGLAKCNVITLLAMHSVQK